MNKKDLIKRLKNFKFHENILNAFKKVDRTLFVPAELKDRAYEDVALPIGYCQSISQPYTIALMLTLLDIHEGQEILEIGSGSGYVLALLSKLNKNGKILGIEKIGALAENSKERLKKYKNIEVIHGDAMKLENKKFDRILASASFREIPQKLIDYQLKTKGIFVAPVKNSIIIIKKDLDGNRIKEYPGFSFVPIV
ncbi:methyltransferase domain-containing protein [Candidatus Pacearchaeota archaeon]|nr:methyltransferase domain-containing protein [Candidatus Pacearchaeota archaeon]